MRARDAILAMVLAACSEPAPMVCTPGESRSCACPTGATGAQICADDGSRLGECVCADLDGGGGEMDAGVHEHDAGSDAGAYARDAGQDAGPPDAGPVDAGPPWGECWLAPQGGCPEGYACRLRYIFPDEPREPRCEPAGTLREGEPCMLEPGTQRDPCAPGLWCSGSTVVSGRCYRYCHPDHPEIECGPDHLGDPMVCRPRELDGHTYYVCQRNV